jgi:diguanylate cyclase (GGDEF)-like protein/PAS domain S-box-containing protein
MSIEHISGSASTRRSGVVLLLAAVLTAVYVVAPAGGIVDSIRVAAPIIAAGAVLFGIVIHQPERATPWYLISTALLSLAAAHVSWTVLSARGDETFPSIADGFHALFWCLILLAVVMQVRDSLGEHDSFGAFEVAIVTIAVGVGIWLFVVERYLSDSNLDFVATMWAGTVPFLGGLAFAGSVRIAANGAFREFSPRILMIGIGVILVGDIVRGALELRGEFDSGSVVAAAGVLGPLTIAAAALDPTMAADNRRSAPNAMLGIPRTVGLSVAVLTPITVLFALLVSDLGTTTTRVVIALAAFAAVVLALARMWGLVAAVRGLTERRGQDRLAAMVEHSSDVVMLVDESGHIKYASPGLSGTLGHRAADWTGRPLIDLIAEEDRATAAEEFEQLFELGPDGTVRFESSLVRVDGQRRRMEATFANLLGGDAVDGIVVTFRDVTEQRDLERKLSHRAFHDELTGLANRALFLDRMDHALRVQRSDADPVVVLFVDLDDFKSVNDALGHGVGDQLLRAIADRIRQQSGSGDTPARLGGDEFALLLEDRGGIERALDVAEQLLNRLREPVRLAGYDLTVLASVGVAVAAPGMTTSSLLRDADIAMYEAKRAGKGQIKIFDPAMRLGATTHLEYRSELGLALENRQLRLVFQPLVDLRTGEVLGAEALVRWMHPTRGEIAPAEFIPVAERSGLIKEIGNWVLHQSMREAVRWQSRGDRYVGINVSAVQLRAEGFVDEVSEALRLTGLAPAQVLLEVTEAVLVDEVDSGSNALVALRDLGVRIAIDDFGTGYCSLSYLQKFPVDVVKIDRQFVDEVDGDANRSSLARMILQMTSSMGVTSVAEGIERPEQLAALRQFGCDVGQGYLLSRPLELDAVHQRFGVDLASAP